jgi:ferritin-like metal-binding protein YciE
VIARKETVVDRAQIDELLYQALETELGGEQVYLAAIECAVTDELKEEWKKYLDETRTHQTVLEGVFEVAGLDTATETPGRAIVRQKAAGLVEAMQTALDTTPGVGAQLVAAESVVEAESKDHQNWVLIGLVA